MIRYYKLFDLLNRNGMKKSDLRKIISSKTVAKLSKGENITTDVIDKICLFLNCQPSDIMEVVKVSETDQPNITIVSKSYLAMEGNENIPDIIATDEEIQMDGETIGKLTDNPFDPNAQ